MDSELFTEDIADFTQRDMRAHRIQHRNHDVVAMTVGSLTGARSLLIARLHRCGIATAAQVLTRSICVFLRGNRSSASESGRLPFRRSD